MADNELEGTEVSDEVRTASESSTSQRLAALSKEEKQLILIGVFLFYGTRRVTQKKISALKTIIHHLQFDSDGIPHRDPTDEELKLAETTGWVLNVLRSNFAGESALPEEDVKVLLREVTRSLDKDLKREPDPEQQAARIVEALEKLAGLEGNASTNEKNLIRVVKSQSKFITGNSWRIIGSIALIVSIVVLAAVFDDVSVIFTVAVLAATCLSALKWVTQSLSRALI